MIVDSHYHLDERMETMEQILARMERANVNRTALIATMCDPLPWGRKWEVASGLINKLLNGPLKQQGLGLYRGVINSNGQFESLGAKVKIYPLPDNEPIARAMQSHPDKFYGWIFVNPCVGDPLAEIEKWAGQPGWVGVKAHPNWHRYPIATLAPVADWCSARGWPLLIHLGGDVKCGDFRFLPERHPRLKILYAHAGVPFFKELWTYARSKPNIWVDLSSPSYVSPSMYSEVVKSLGAERCLMGTDGPYCQVDRQAVVQDILRLSLSSAEKDCILGQNFLELCGIEG